MLVFVSFAGIVLGCCFEQLALYYHFRVILVAFGCAWPYPSGQELIKHFSGFEKFDPLSLGNQVIIHEAFSQLPRPPGVGQISEYRFTVIVNKFIQPGIVHQVTAILPGLHVLIV